ncbi:MFS transporter [Streptomyces sp. NPDC051940]|uniref:MFS transporter n=1 Tax=Streptomyces sp. NPDC051940 TaxID=3155675 RepID=UPI0034465726
MNSGGAGQADDISGAAARVGNAPDKAVEALGGDGPGGSEPASRAPECGAAGSAAEAAEATDAPPTPVRGRGRVVAALMLSMSLAALEGTIVATAVPQIVADLGGFSVFSWVFSGYMLAVTVTLPVYGKLADTFGRKPVLLAGITVFLVGGVACAGAWSMTALIAFRILQGLGGGAIQGTVQTVAADLYPLKERPRITAALASVWAVSAVIGPGLGGLLAGYADWRWIFLLNLPLGAIALVLLVRNLREPARERTSGPVDWPGALAVFAAGGLLVTGLVQGGVAWPWISLPSLLLFGGSVAATAATVLIERRAAEPIIPSWVWRRRTIASVNVSLGALGILMVAPTVFLPTYAQTVLGLDPTRAGFVMSVMTISWPLSASLSSRLYNRVGFRQSALIGITLAALILAAFPLLPYPGSAWQPALLMLLLGGALGIYQLPLLVGVQSTVGWSQRGTATSSVLFHRQLGQSLGAAVFGAVANATLAGRVTSSAHGTGDTVTAPSDGLRRAVATATDHVFLGAAAAAVIALVALLWAPRRFPVIEQEG